MTSAIDGKTKTKSENNPWYLLATMYGEPTTDELIDRNRRAWNRYMACWLNKNHRDLLTSKQMLEEVVAFSKEELTDLRNAFAAPHRQAASAASEQIPELEHADLIDLSNVDFDRGLWMEGFFFPVRCDFSSSIFSHSCNFKGIVFSDASLFHETRFSRLAIFGGVSFAGAAFQGAIFSDIADFDGAIFNGPASFEKTMFSGPANFPRAFFRPMSISTA